MGNNKGYTLLELLVVTVLFLVVTMMATSAFNTILGKTTTQSKSAEAQIEGIVGLQMLRFDIEHAGYGLLWDYQDVTALNYAEVAESPVTGVDSTAFNEKAPTIPRSVIGGKSTATKPIIDTSGSSNTNPGSGYLVVKSVLASIGVDAKRWSYVRYSSVGATNSSYIKQWNASNDLKVNDRVVTLVTTFSTQGEMSKKLVTNGTTFSYKIDSPTMAIPDLAFKSQTPYATNVVYAVGTNDLLMPYNRADYYVKRPLRNMPANCNKGTGILYKGAVINNAARTNSYVEYPLLDCVGDLQVMYQLDTDGDGVAATYSNVDGTSVEGTEGASLASVQAPSGILGSAASLRNSLQLLHIYILAHEGGKDLGYVYPQDSIVVADPVYKSEGRTWSAADMATTFGADWRNFRWKVYTLTVRPKNM